MKALIVAHSLNNVIGCNGNIPWKIKGEQLRFKNLTLGKTIIMGRRTFEEIGKPLPNRKTILISSTLSYLDQNCVTVPDMKTALELCRDEEVYISGGASLYQESIDFVDRMYITVIQKEFKGDTFFPEVDWQQFDKTYEKYVDGEIPYIELTYERKNR